MADDDDDPRRTLALARYQIISAYLALEPKRGQKGPLLEQLASRTWPGPGGSALQPAAETIRGWVRRYRTGGLESLEDQPRTSSGVQVLAPEEIELCAQLKREVPERSLDRIIKILEDTRRIEHGRIRRSTLHRALAPLGLTTRQLKKPDLADLDRWEADFPGDLYQSDMRSGPWLPDPARPGKLRQAWLYAFLDDHSRLLLHGRFSFRENLPALELVFRRCIQKWGLCRRVYYDNGQVYRSHHMKHICATLGIAPPTFTKPYRPEGHGKIEALNRLIKSAFVAEVRASHIRTLDELNEAFLAWTDLEYNRRPHAEIGEPPLERWKRGAAHLRYAEDDKLRQAFLWREHRSPDKAGLFSLCGQRYQTLLGRKRVEVRFDPEALELVEIWHQGRFVERIGPFVVHTHRRPRPEPDEPAARPAQARPPTVDWLAHLVDKRQRLEFLEPSPRQLAEQAAQGRAQADQAVAELLAQRLDPAIFDESDVRAWLDRFGPFDAARAAAVLDRLFAQGARPDHHIHFFLEAIQKDAHGGTTP
jgi:transposase InsO family protein